MNTDAIILFYAGIVTQAFLLLIGRMTLKDVGVILACAAGSLLGFAPGKHEYHYDIHTHYFIVACVFCIGYAVFFKKKVMERINKEILLVWTLVAIYTALQIPFIAAHTQLLFPLLALSILPIANAFAGFDQSYGWKVFFYIWFLIVIVGIIASQFAFSTMLSVFGHDAVDVNPWTMFAIGMSFLFLAINLWYVIELIPLPGKHQSFDDRMAEVEECMDIMAEDYDAEKVRLWKTASLFILTAFVLAFNFFRHAVNDAVMVSILISILPLVDRFFYTTPAECADSQDVADNIDTTSTDDTAPAAEYTPLRPDPSMPDEDILA